MSESNSRFTPSSQTVSQKVASTTVGLVALSDFRKRRAEALEQQDREARSGTNSGTATEKTTPGPSRSETPDLGSEEDVGSKPSAKRKRKTGKSLLSFEDDEGQDDGPVLKSGPEKVQAKGAREKGSKFKPNASVSIIPTSTTKSALRHEAAQRESLRREFLAVQEAVKATDIAIPFTFYDGSNIPAGTVRVKKGDFVSTFLDKSRKVGAELGVGKRPNDAASKRVPNAQALKAWARIGVDDMMMVRGSVIIPHHYDFYFFIMNKNLGPGGRQLFDFSAETRGLSNSDDSSDQVSGLLTASTREAEVAKRQIETKYLEGADEDPAWTKVVDRRWYERNKHIYPASTWQNFDPEKDYITEVRKDTGGNTFFFAG